MKHQMTTRKPEPHVLEDCQHEIKKPVAFMQQTAVYGLALKLK